MTVDAGTVARLQSLTVLIGAIGTSFNYEFAPCVPDFRAGVQRVMSHVLGFRFTIQGRGIDGPFIATRLHAMTARLLTQFGDPPPSVCCRYATSPVCLVVSFSLLRSLCVSAVCCSALCLSLLSPLSVLHSCKKLAGFVRRGR